MSEEEKEICIGRRSGKTYNKIQEMAKEIVRLQKELEEKTTILMAGADKVKQLEKESEEYHRIKKELIRVNKKIYDVDTIDEFIKTIDKLQKVIDLMAELLCGIDVMNELGKESWNWNKEQMKEHFYKKVEEENA